METERKPMSPGFSFAAGILVGAFAVFVPFSSSSHAGPNIDASAQRSADEVQSAAPNFLWWIGDDPRLAKAREARSKEESEAAASKSQEASTTDTCDVQLD